MTRRLGIATALLAVPAADRLLEPAPAADGGNGA